MRWVRGLFFAKNGPKHLSPIGSGQVALPEPHRGENSPECGDNQNQLAARELG